MSKKAYRIKEAAALISVGETTFKQEVLPEIRIIKCGRLRLIPDTELDRWVELNSQRIAGMEEAAA